MDEEERERLRQLLAQHRPDLFGAPQQTPALSQSQALERAGLSSFRGIMERLVPRKKEIRSVGDFLQATLFENPVMDAAGFPFRALSIGVEALKIQRPGTFQISPDVGPAGRSMRMFGGSYMESFTGVHGIAPVPETQTEVIVSEIGSLAGLLSVLLPSRGRAAFRPGFFRRLGKVEAFLGKGVTKSLAGAGYAAERFAVTQRFAEPILGASRGFTRIPSVPMAITGRIMDLKAVGVARDYFQKRGLHKTAQHLEDITRGALLLTIDTAGILTPIGISDATFEEVGRAALIGGFGAGLGATVANIPFLQSAFFQKAALPILSRTTTRAQIAQGMMGALGDVSFGAVLGETDPGSLVKNALLGYAFAGLDAPWYVHEADRFIFSRPTGKRHLASGDDFDALPTPVQEVMRERIEFFMEPQLAQDAVAETFRRMGQGDVADALEAVQTGTAVATPLEPQQARASADSQARHAQAQQHDFEGGRQLIVAPVHQFVKRWARLDGLELDERHVQAAVEEVQRYVQEAQEGTFRELTTKLKNVYERAAGTDAPPWKDVWMRDLVPTYLHQVQTEQVGAYGWDEASGTMTRLEGFDFRGDRIDERTPATDLMLAGMEAGAAENPHDVVRYVRHARGNDGKQESIAGKRFREGEWARFSRSMLDDGYYLFSGKAASSQFIFTRFVTSTGDTPGELARIFKERSDLRPGYNRLRAEYVEENRQHGNAEELGREYDRIFASNVRYEELKNDRPIGQMKGENFIVDVVDFNKRSQIGNTDYFRLLPEFLVDSEGNRAELRFALAEDLEIDGMMSTDGGVVVHDDVLAMEREGVGVAAGGGMSKAFITSKDVDGEGLLMTKAMHHGAGEALSKAMKEQNLTHIIFRSSAKQIGNRRVHRFGFQEGKLVPDGDLVSYPLRPEDIRLSDSIYDSGAEKKGATFAKPGWMMAVPEQLSAEAIASMENFLVSPAGGEPEANKLFDRYLQFSTDKDLDALFEGPNPPISRVRMAGDRSLPAMLGDLRYEAFHDRFAEYIVRDSSEHLDGESFESTPGDDYLPTVSANRGNDAMVFLESVNHPAARLAKIPRAYFQKALMNHFVKRLSRPHIRSAAHARLRIVDWELQQRLGVEKEAEIESPEQLEARVQARFEELKQKDVKQIFVGGPDPDVLKKIREELTPSLQVTDPVRYGNLVERRQDEVEKKGKLERKRQTSDKALLARAREETQKPKRTVTRQLTDDVIFLDELHRGILVPFEGKEITLGELVRLSEKGTPAEKKAALRALRAVALRTPMEDISGAQPVRVAGFTGRAGAGAVVHPRTLARLQSADNDGDEVAIYFGLPETYVEGLVKNRDNLDRVDDQGRRMNDDVEAAIVEHFVRKDNQGNPVFEGLDAGLVQDPAAMFDPRYRARVAHAVQSGNALSAGVAFNAGVIVHTLFSAARKANGVFSETLPDGTTIRYTVRKGDDGRELRVRRMAAVRAGVDAAKLPGSIVRPGEMRARLLEATFEKIEVTLKGGNPVRVTNMAAFAGRGIKLGDRAVSLTGVGRVVGDGEIVTEHLTAAGRFNRINSLLYSRNQDEDRAWSYGEIIQGVADYPQALGQHLLSSVAGQVARLDYDDSLLRRVVLDDVQVWGGLIEGFNTLTRDHADILDALGGEPNMIVPQRHMTERLRVLRRYLMTGTLEVGPQPRVVRRLENLQNLASSDSDMGKYADEMWAVGLEGRRVRLIEGLSPRVNNIDEFVKDFQKTFREEEGRWPGAGEIAEAIRDEVGGGRTEILLWERGLTRKDLEGETFPTKIKFNRRARERFLESELSRADDFLSNDLDDFVSILDVAPTAIEGSIEGQDVRAILGVIDDIKAAHAEERQRKGLEGNDLDERATALASARRSVERLRARADEIAEERGYSREAMQDLVDSALLSSLRPPGKEKGDFWRTSSSRLGYALASDRAIKKRGEIITRVFGTFLPPGDPQAAKTFFDTHPIAQDGKTYRARRRTVERLLRIPEGTPSREASRLADKFTEILEGYPTMRDDPKVLTDFIRTETGKAELSDLTMDDYNKVLGTLNGIREGHGFFNWFRKKVRKKGVPRVSFMGFPQSAADQLATKDIIYMHRAAGDFDEPNLVTADPKSGTLEKVYGDAVEVMSMHHLVIHRRKMGEVLAESQSNENISFLNERIGWMDRGIRQVVKGVGVGKRVENLLGEIAAREREVDGARASGSQAALAIALSRLKPVEKDLERVLGQRFIIERKTILKAGILGVLKPKGVAEEVTGRQALNLIKDDFDLLDKLYEELVALTPELSKETFFFRDTDAPQPHINLVKTLGRMTDLLDRGILGKQHITQDLQNLLIYLNEIQTIHAIDRAREMRLPSSSDEVLRYRYNEAADEAITGLERFRGMQLRSLSPSALAARMDEVLTSVGRKAEEGESAATAALRRDALTVRDYLSRDLHEHDFRRIVFGKDKHSQLDWDLWLLKQGQTGDVTSRSNARVEYMTARLMDDQPFQRTGFLKGFWPHLDSTERGVREDLEARLARFDAQTPDLDARAMERERLAVLNAKKMRDDTFNDGYLLEPQAEALLEPRSWDLVRKVTRQQRAGSTLKRSDNIGGYSYSRDVLFKYADQISRATFRGISTMLSENAIRDFERRQEQDSYENFPREDTAAWAQYSRIYLHQTLGYPSTYPGDVLDLAKLRLRGSSLHRLSDHQFFVRGFAAPFLTGKKESTRQGLLNRVAVLITGSQKLGVFEQEALKGRFRADNGREPTEDETSKMILKGERDKMRRLTTPFMEVKTDQFFPGERETFHELFLEREGREASAEDEAVYLARKKQEDGPTKRVFNAEGMESMSAIYRKLSNLEGKWALASLLMRPKSAIANIVGGDTNSIIFNGSKAWRHSIGGKVFGKKSLEAWQSVDSSFTSMQDVDEWVMGLGVTTNWLIHELSYDSRVRSDAKFGAFVRDVARQIQEQPKVFAKMLGAEGDRRSWAKVVTDTAKEHGIDQRLLATAGWFMQVSEMQVRLRAFKAAYLQAFWQFEGIVESRDSSFLIDHARKAVSATQFLYSADSRPAFSSTSAGKVYSRFKLWSWNSVRLRRTVFQEAKRAGYAPGSESFNRLRRMIQADFFMLAIVQLMPYSVFEKLLPPPYNWFDDFYDLLFGDPDERDRAFFGKFSTISVIPDIGKRLGLSDDLVDYTRRITAPLNELLPPALRPIKALDEALRWLTNGETEDRASYTFWTLLPGGTLGYDLYNTYNNPRMYDYFLFDLPAHRHSRVKKMIEKKGRKERFLREQGK